MTLVRGDAVEVLKLHVGLGGNVELTSCAEQGAGSRAGAFVTNESREVSVAKQVVGQSEHAGAFLGGESVKFCSIWVEPALCEGFDELRFLGSETSEGILKFGGGRRAQIWRT
jgi:hypothetical protein